MASNAIRISILANARTAIREIGKTTRAIGKMDRAARRASRGGIAAVSRELDRLGKVASLAGAGLKVGGKTLGYSLMGFVALGVVAGAGQVASALSAGILAALPAVGVLPAFALAAASALIVLKVATSGVSDALKEGLAAAASGSAKDLKAFNKTLSKLAPSVRATLRQIVLLRPAFMGARNAIAGKFFTGFAREIKTLSDTYLPLLVGHATKVASAFNRAARGIGDFLREGGTVRSFAGILTSVRTAIDNISGGLPNLARGFVPLFSVSSSFLPGLTKGFGDATKRFAEFMEQAEKNGTLKAFIQGGLDALKALTGILGSVGGILKSVFVDANAGAGSFFAVIGTVLKRVDAFLNSAEGMKAVSAVWQVFGAIGAALGGALGAILPQLGKALVILSPSIVLLAQGLGRFLETLAPILPVVGELAALFAGELAKALPILAPALLAVGTAIGGLLTAVAPLIPVIAEVAAIIGTALAEGITALLPSLGPLVTTLGAGLLTVVKALAPVLPVIATVLASLLTAVTPLIKPIADMVAQLASGLLPTIVTLLPSLDKLLAALGTSLLTAITSLAPYLPPMVASFAELAPGIIDCVDALVPIIPLVVKLAALLITSLMPVLTSSPKVFRILAANMSTFANVVRAFPILLGKVIYGVKDFVTGAMRVFGGFIDYILWLPGKIVSGLLNGLQSQWHKVTDWFSGAIDLIPAGIRQALGINSPSRVMRDLMLKTGDGAIAGLKASIPGIRKAVDAVSGVISGGVATDATVKLRADAQVSANGAGAGALPPLVINNYNATGIDPAEVGRKTVAAIEAWQKRTGRQRLLAV